MVSASVPEILVCHDVEPTDMDLRATRKRGHFENISPIFRGDSPNHGFMDQQIHGISTNQTKLVSATNGPAPL